MQSQVGAATEVWRQASARAAVLIELSGGWLTFAEDIAATFSVLDTDRGSVRDPRLLSGGEQFQASLALALGLVEIAARAGSHIKCLFLDEGFGALTCRSADEVPPTGEGCSGHKPGGPRQSRAP
jgi:exonuclease SbcC